MTHEDELTHPALFANATFVRLNRVFTRLIFGEVLYGEGGTEPSFNQAIMLPTADAVAMARHILELYEKHGEQKPALIIPIRNPKNDD